ncbi:hypothetical protein C5167_016979 [Papaver somniferum]|uniref:Importin N-terminal domain-containing protein n=1 Tax=Papaver somniferum TaxID=3469 RepID=A0A4Y7II41_PAPSO|nr:hypothetical protein C5167_016979 [Papaver somniferum]
MTLSYQQYIKSELLPCLGASDRHIRSTVGTIISVIIQQGRVPGWPELLQALLHCLDSKELSHMEGAMDALSKALVRSTDQYFQGLFVLATDPTAEVRKLKRNLRIVYDAVGTLADAVGEELNQVDPASAVVLYEKEFVVCSLDLLSGLAEGLGKLAML